MEAESIDIYINYSCNYRCKHCFLGKSLNKKDILSSSQVRAIVEYCKDKYGTKEVVILGGEPSIHKEIDQIVLKINEVGITNIRIVTNGGISCERYLKRNSNKIKPKIVFSVDGGSSQYHDAMRGEGAFEQLLKSINSAKELGYKRYYVATAQSFTLISY